jgi:hypothetical protein
MTRSRTGKAPAPAARPPRRRAALIGLALVVLSGAAYAIFLITHVPQAVAIDELMTAKPNELFRFNGPPDGLLVLMNVRGSGLATISAPGARLAEPTAGTLGALAQEAEGFRPSTKGVELRVTNDVSSVAALSIAIARNGNGEPAIDVRPRILPDGNGLAITASGATLRVTVNWTSPPPGKPQTGPMLMSDDGILLPIGRAVIEVPERGSLFVGSSAGANLRVDLGNAEEHFSTGGLTVQGLEVRSADGGSLVSLACGKPEGDLQPGLTGEIGTRTCDSLLHVQDFKLDDKAHLQLSGSGFLMKDRAPQYWQLMSNIASNVVLQTAFTSLVSGVVAWAVFWLGFRKPKET